MRTTIATALLILVSGFLAAGPVTAEQTTLNASCAKWSDLARLIMRNRQAGDPVADLMTISMGDARADRVFQQIVLRAYDDSRYRTDEYQQRAIADFRDDAYVRCIKQQWPGIK